MPRHRLPSACALLCLSVVLFPAVGLGATYYVDNQNPAATDAGPGTQATPYRTISAAATQHGGPGNTILVLAGTYREQVTVGMSGASGSPFIFQAQGAVVIEGSDDLASTALWIPVSGDVYLASSVTWDPVQVFVDGERLIESALAPGSLPPMSFRYVAGTGLYVNAAGGNPGAHGTQVGRRAHGFRLPGRSWVTIRGFTVSRSEDKGVYALAGSHFLTLENNIVRHTGGQGVQLAGSSNGVIAGNQVHHSGDHGIVLTTGVTATVVRRNWSHHNARPLVRAANGIYLTGSPGNRVEANRLSDNQDSGVQINNASNDVVCVQNVSWSNGDHGYDHLSSSGTVHMGDVAYSNYRDGFSFEGNAPGGKVYNCIGVNNGLTIAQYNLWVDAASSVGFASDYNLFWNSTGQSPIHYGATIYATVASFASATGNDSHSLQADPRFANGVGGDFHLRSDSPVIDNAHSGAPAWSAVDAEGDARFDVLLKPNGGAGPVTYADRGAFEFRGEIFLDQPPGVSCPAGVIVNEGATASFAVTAVDPDGQPILSLTADVSGLPAGHNATFTVGAGNTSGTFQWTPTFDHAGIYTVTFRASNVLSGTRSTTITVLNMDRPPVVAAPNNLRTTPGSLVEFNVSASDGDGDAITSLVADMSALPAGHNATFTVNASNTQGTFRWTPAIGQTGNFRIHFTATANGLSGSSETRVMVRKTGLGATADDGENAPVELSLSAPTPNPSSARVLFQLSLPVADRVEWGVYDLQGRELWSEGSFRSAGRHVLEWTGQDRRSGHAASGLYFLKVRTGGIELTRRFVRL